MPNSRNINLRVLENQSAEELSELKQKIRIHRLKILTMVFAAIAVLIGLFFIAFLYFDQKTYTSYEVLEQIKHVGTEASEYQSFQGNVLQYTNDGAVYTDLSGNVIWNQTYEMEQPCITMCESYLAIYEQGSNRIYIMDTTGQQGTISTVVPVQRVSVASQGTVAVLMEDSGTSYLHIYNKEGKQLAAGELHIENSGYPLDISLSFDAQKLAVSMLEIGEGIVESTIVFYNYGTVGQNEIDNIVASYTYSEMLVPSIRFVSNEKLIAFGDSKVIIYEGKQKPAVAREIDCKGNIRSIYSNEEYFGLVYDSQSSAKGYHTTIYNMKGNTVLELDFELDYTDIYFLQNGLLCIKNDKDCALYTMQGHKRFAYKFDRSLYDIISGSSQLEYLVILSGETNRIKLKDNGQE